MEKIKAGTWVEIQSTVLEAGQRASQVPADTQAVPLIMRAKGFLNQSAQLGEDVEITTAIGRCVHGELVAQNPAYSHGFGTPIQDLQRIKRNLVKILGKQKQPK